MKVLWFLLVSVHACWASADIKLSSHVRERFVLPQYFSWSSDSMLRVRRQLNDVGFNQFVLDIRLGARDPESSEVYFPTVRSRRSEIETFISSAQHARSEVILRPIIALNPELGVASRLTNIRPKSTSTWFSTYARALGMFASIAQKRRVAEIVMGVGLSQLWRAELVDEWKQLFYQVRRKVGEGVILSIEISDEDSLLAWENWRVQDPKGFSEMAQRLDKVRFNGSPIEESQGSGRWSVVLTKQRIEERIRRVKTLFPQKQIAISNISFPACRDRVGSSDEILCVEGAQLDRKYQLQAMDTWSDSWGKIDPLLRASVGELSFLAASTDFEPDDPNFDSRFLIYDSQVNQRLGVLLSQIASPQVAILSNVPASARLACIFYDQQKSLDKVGPIQARLLENLLGAFPAWRVRQQRISKYAAGDLDECSVGFYLGVDYNQQPPDDFFSDLVLFSQEKPFVWFNYKLQSFYEKQERRSQLGLGPRFPFSARIIDQPLKVPDPQEVDTGWFRFFEYKGEVFEKLAKWDRRSNRLMASPELHLIEIYQPEKVKVLAQARHSKDGRVTPYAVRADNFWYIADSPFSFVHYEDRYLIFCDLLWDILQENAPPGPIGALVRLEDVNPSQNPSDLRWAIDYLAAQGVPFSMAVIPYYSSVYGSPREPQGPVWRPVWQYPDFVGTLRYAKARGASFVMHGLAHQAGDLISGYDGVSGADYEFWQYPEDQPLPWDSVNFVLDSLEKAEDVFNRIGMTAVAWEVPHYASSALDSVIFGKLFAWNYHRSLYFDGKIQRNAELAPQYQMFVCDEPKCRQERRRQLNQLDLEVDHSQFSGQIFPYRIWQDTYGQGIIPETLGMIDYAFHSDQTWRPVSRPEDLLRRARKLRVVRGSYASFFWHVDLLSRNLPYYKRHKDHYEKEGGRRTLMAVVKGLKDLGYEFKSISDCALFPGPLCR